MIICQGLAALGLAAVAGCSNGPAASGACLDDSKACIESRTAAYNSMVGDPTKAWMGEQPTREVYASGVRQFAWRTSKDKLSCEELAAGLRDLANAKASLSQGHIPGSSAERNNQVKALTDDVVADLSRTAKAKRCKLA